MSDELHSGIEHLYHIETFMASMTDLDELLAVIIKEASLATDAESCSLALFAEDSNELVFCVALGEGDERSFEHKLTRIHMPMGRGIIGSCAKTRQVINIKDAYRDPRFDQKADRKTGFRTKSILAVPMVWRNRLVGVVEAVNKRGDCVFNERDEHVLAVLAGQAALVIENARLIDENLRQARLAALGQGIAGAAHCIKNILNGVSGGEYILGIGIKRRNMQKVEQGWDILSRNTGMMKELVLDMLSVSRPRAPEYEAADINEICTRVVDMMAERARERGAEFRLDLQADIGSVDLDPKGMYRCMLNLVGNALEASDKDEGEIRITTNAGEGRLEIIIADNGCGIAEENLAEVFRPFFSTKGSNGTGLGLAVTQKIIQEHGGDIRAYSEPGRGTKFRIDLPLRLPH